MALNVKPFIQPRLNPGPNFSSAFLPAVCKCIEKGEKKGNKTTVSFICFLQSLPFSLGLGILQQKQYSKKQ